MRHDAFSKVGIRKEIDRLQRNLRQDTKKLKKDS